MDLSLSQIDAGAGAYTALDSAYSPLIEVETFEDATLGRWNKFNYPSDRATLGEAAALRGSDYGLRLADGGFMEMRAMPSYSNTLPNYLEPGTEIRFRFRYHAVSSAANAQWRFNFGKATDNDVDEYELHFIYDGTMRLLRDDSSTTGKDELAYDYGGFNPSIGTIYEIVIRWAHPDETDDFVITARNMSTGTVISRIAGNDTFGNMFTGGGIQLWKNGYQGVEIDGFYMRK